MTYKASKCIEEAFLLQLTSPTHFFPANSPPLTMITSLLTIIIIIPTINPMRHNPYPIHHLLLLLLHIEEFYTTSP